MGVRWTEEELIVYLKENDYVEKDGVLFRNSCPLPKPEQSARRKVKRSVAAEEANEESCPGRYRLVVTSYCRRHTDPDNLCPKWFIDELVRAKILTDDSSKYIEAITKRATKISQKEKERTVIEIYAEEDAGGGDVSGGDGNEHDQ